jgi:hypothetical protein
VVSAASLNANTVEVTFDMNMSDVGLTTAGNYVFAGPAAITASGVTKISPTHVHVAITGEMLTGVDNYTVTVSGVQSTYAVPIDPEYDTATFDGIGALPRVASASMPDATHVHVVFNEPMQETAAIETAARYVITGPTVPPAVIVASAVLQLDMVTVILMLSTELLQLGAYNVVVTPTTDIVDTAGNELDPAYADADFVGKGILPQVDSASAPDKTHVHVVFTEPMQKTAAIETASRYHITGPTIITVVTATLQGDDTTVILDVTGEMHTGSGNYNVHVSPPNNIQDIVGNQLNIVHADADFDGVGERPHVEGAIATAPCNVRVEFSELMDIMDVELTTPTNYVFTLGLTASHVDIVDSTHVDVTVNEQAYITYTVFVYNATDLAGNPVADPPFNSASYKGYGTPPKLLPDGISVDNYNFYIDYTKIVVPGDAEDIDNYTIDPDIHISAVTQITGTRYRVTTTDAQQVGVVYTLVASNIYDLEDQLIDPDNDTATFIGKVWTPGFLFLFPPGGSIGVPVRSVLRQQAMDSTVGATGIDTTTWTIRVTVNGSTYTVMENGVFAVGFAGSISGDPLDTTYGVTAKFHPRHGHWEPDATYTVYAEVADNEGTLVNHTWDVTFGSVRCFEDTDPAASPDDTKILTTLTRFPACEKLRRAMLPTCSRSMNQVAQARTLLWRANATGLRTILALMVDLTYLDGISLCDRVPVIEVQIVLAPYTRVVDAALAELRQILRDEVLLPVEQSLRSADANQVVSALGAIVVMAAFA